MNTTDMFGLTKLGYLSDASLLFFKIYFAVYFIFFAIMGINKFGKKIQYLTKMESKNLIYTQLGLPFRPKLGGWEFLNESPDYSSHSVIDWSNDHSRLIHETLSIRLPPQAATSPCSMASREKAFPPVRRWKRSGLTSASWWRS